MNAPMPMQTRLKMIASGPPERRPRPPSTKKLISRFATMRIRTPMAAPMTILVRRGVTRMAPVL